jgi:hypothetical protein
MTLSIHLYQFIFWHSYQLQEAMQYLFIKQIYLKGPVELNKL